jgi:G:T-mismatch repair DNA endonuclease (very short patch repair protein)
MPARKSPKHYLEACLVAHNGRYSYDEASFSRTSDPIKVHCPDHGWFQQRLLHHMRGAGCPQCAGRGVDWVARFTSVHGETYDYSRVVFRGYKEPVEVVCRKHGAFYQTPDNHFRGRQGCPSCARTLIRESKQLSIEQFVERARAVHGNRFDYKMEQFENMLSSQVHILCPDHGWFKQTPVNHLAGKVGCSRCNNMKSTPEDAVAAFLSRLTTVIQRDRTIIGPKELDIYLPDHQLAVEYCGMYWHSHGDKKDERKNKLRHAEKHRLCAEKGIRLITLYETEWQERQKTIKRLLRNALGKTRGRLMARKCRLGRPTPQEARVFYEHYHPQGGNGHGEHFGLYHKDKLVACMRFNYGANDRGAKAKDRQWTLSRYATRLSVAGAASRLFKAFVEEYAPSQVKSFSDNRLFSGGMYEQLGFVLEEEVGPDYQIWSPKIGLRPKPHYQRRALQKRLDEHGRREVFDEKTDTRTESEITYLMGARRIYDCGKKRWVWTATDV